MTLPDVTPADAELAAVTVLRARINASADATVNTATVATRIPPADLTSPFVMVRRVGGILDNVVQDRARLDVIVWHDGDAERMTLASACRAFLHAARGTQGIQRVAEFLGPSRLPDPADPNRQVVLFTVELTVRAS